MARLCIWPILVTGAFGCDVEIPPRGLPPMGAARRDTAPPDIPQGDTAVEQVPGQEPGVGPLWEVCALYLDCSQEIPYEPKIPCDLRVEGASGRVWYDGPAGVEVRGRTSRYFPKKQYAVELWDEAQESVKVDLLGMGAEDDWVINGAWIDRALMRNKFGFDLYQSLGGTERYAPESAYCTLTLNGDWLGIYFLSERVNREDDRVDIQSGQDGESFIVKQDDRGGIVDNRVGNGLWELVYPKGATEEGLGTISGFLEGWMDSVLSGDPGDPVDGVAGWMDLDSTVDIILLQELLKNHDAFFLSAHMWKDVDGALFHAPWDLDLTLGQPTYNNNASPEGWLFVRPELIRRMFDIPGFRERFVNRWWELREGPFHEEALLERLRSLRNIMGDTVYENFQVWPISEVQFSDSLPEVSSFDEEYQYIMAWLPARLAWMDENIAAY